ncbi:MAG: heparinase II/III family protein [bacterium]
MNFTPLRFAIKKIGLIGTINLVAEKIIKKRRLRALLHCTPSRVVLLELRETTKKIEYSDEAKTTIIDRADEILRDENYVFTFIYQLGGIADPWNYDPLEKKYWPKKHYEETELQSPENPSDVKIVWEINRFKYLPLLAEAAFVTGDKKYADEIERRILSWVEDNPFGKTINWSSPLEIAIRGISWTVSLKILARAGFEIAASSKIQESLWQHAAALNAGLSTDKIVKTNHLVGECAGLYILASSFNFPEAKTFRDRAKKIFESSILEQTYLDGASKESSGWYHTFVTDFADVVLRISLANGDSFGSEFSQRFTEMVRYRNSETLPDGDALKYGDCDFGKVVNLSSKWRDVIFGTNSLLHSERVNYFETAGHLTARLDKNYLFARAGDFGWGGDGFSSHAHDDFLAPIVALDGVNILVDPGTFAYNGAKEERNLERIARMHNSISITPLDAGFTEPQLKPSFGWLKTRPPAELDILKNSPDSIEAKGVFGEWKESHERIFLLATTSFAMEDAMHFDSEKLVEWNLHFHPRWRAALTEPSKISLSDFRDNHYELIISGIEVPIEISRYDFAPAYRQKSKAWKMQMRAKVKTGEKLHVRFVLQRTITSTT